MAFRTFGSRLVITVPEQEDLELSVAWVDGSDTPITEIDEGEEAFMKISVDLNGVTREAGTFLSFTFRTPSTAEFLAGYPGDTQALSSAWARSLDGPFATQEEDSNSVVEDAIKSADAGILHTWVGGGLGSIISLPHDVNELLIPRTSLNIPSEQGDSVSVVLIENPSQGTVVGGTPVGYAALSIVDTFVAPPAATVLDHLTLSSDWVPVSATSTPDVRIGEILGWDSEDDPVVLTAAAIVDSVGSMFKVVEESGHFYVDTDTTAPSFAPPLNGATHPAGILWYFPTFSGTAGAVTVQLRKRIRPEYELIDPNGGTGKTPINITTITDFLNHVNGTTPDRKLIVPTTAQDVFTSTSSGQRKYRRSRTSLIGHRNAIFRLGRGFEIWDCDDVIFQDLLLLMGNQFAATLAGDNVDALIVRQNVRQLKLKNCTLGLSVDEILSIIGVAGVGYAESVLLEDCTFMTPMRQAGHTKGEGHAYGPINYFHNRNIVYNRGLMAGPRQRGPMNKGCEGFLVQNVSRLQWNNGAGWGGMNITPTEETIENAKPTSSIYRGNLFFNSSHGGLRNWAFELSRVDPAESEVCIAQDSGPEQNWHFNPASMPGSFEPVVVGDGISFDDTPSQSALVSSHPFKIPDGGYGYMDAETEEECIAIHNFNLENSGVHAREGDDPDAPIIPGDAALSGFEYYYRQLIRANGAAPTPTPMQIAELFGSDWKGGLNNGAIGQTLTTEFSGTPGAAATVGSMIANPA